MKNKNAQISLEVLAVLGIIVLGSIMVGVYYVSNINSKISIASTVLDPIDDFKNAFGEVIDPGIGINGGNNPEDPEDPDVFYYFNDLNAYPLISNITPININFEIELSADTNFNNIIINNIDVLKIRSTSLRENYNIRLIPYCIDDRDRFELICEIIDSLYRNVTGRREI